MSENPSPETIDPRLNRVLTEYLESVERGEDAAPQRWLDKYPELANELREFFAGRQRFDNLVGSAVRIEEETLAENAPPRNSHSRPRVRYFGNFELLEEIARGGMGVVYRARQVNLKRIVALKMILAGQLASPDDVKRFYAEAEAAAKLEHPNIVPIFEIGQAEGQHFFSMAFVDGESLAHRVSRGVLVPRDAAEIMHKVARAVAFAHVEGVIHRDLKPANILLDEHNEPHVTDFGLAKHLSTSATTADSIYQLTLTGQVLGTPSYMSPEQAAGRTKEIGPSADIYSFGAVLYCLITGRPPFQAATPLDTLRQVVEQDPVGPRQLNAAIPRDLETICMKCLEKEPSRRYGSAQELADELQRFLHDEPIRARPPSIVERGWRILRKQRRSVALTVAAVAATLILAASGLGAWVWYQDWRVGYTLFKTDRPPLVAEILDEAGVPVIPPFTVPTQEPVAVPAGDYELRLSSAARRNQSYQFSVSRGNELGRAQYSLNLEDQLVRSPDDGGGSSLAIPMSYQLVTRAGRADVIVFDNEGIKHPAWPNGGSAWSLRLAKSEDPILRDAPGFHWPWTWTNSDSKSSYRVWHPQVLGNTPDLNGDGVEDLIVAARHQAWLMAVSGNDGSNVLWFAGRGSDLAADRSQLSQAWSNATSSIVLDVSLVAPAASTMRADQMESDSSANSGMDLDGDGVPELVATFANETEPNQSKTVQRWVECLSGKSGKSLWRYDFDERWFDLPAGTVAPPACRWMKGITGWSSVGGSAGGIRDDSYRDRPVYDLSGPWHPVQHRLLIARLGESAQVLVVAGTRLVAIDAVSGKAVWQPFEIDAPLICDPQLADLDGDGTPELITVKATQNPTSNTPRLPTPLQLAAWSLSGPKQLWQRPFSADIHPPCVGTQTPIRWPLIADLDADGRCEVVVPGASSAPNTGWSLPWGEIQIVNGANGTLRWQKRIKTMDSQIDHFLVGPDINGDGHDEVVIATLSGSKYDLYLDALSGKDGQSLWWSKRQTDGTNLWIDRVHMWSSGDRNWPQILVSTYPEYAETRAPAVFTFSSDTGRFVGISSEMEEIQFADADGDSVPELFTFQPNDRNAPILGGTLQAIHTAVGERWRRLSGTAIAGQDYNGDGYQDLLRMDPTGISKFTAVSGLDGRQLWEAQLVSSRIDALNPVRADLDGDGVSDVLAFYGASSSRSAGPPAEYFPVEAVSGRTGKRLWGVKKTYAAINGVQFTDVRDLDGDGAHEVIFSAVTDWDYLRVGGYGTNQTQQWLAVLSGATGEFKWRQPLSVAYGLPGAPANCSYDCYNTQTAPAYSDLDGDRVLDMLLVAEAEGAPTKLELQALSGRDGKVIWRRPHPLPLPLNSSNMLQNATVPVVGDLDRDGKPEVLGLEYITHNSANGTSNRHARLFALDGETGRELWHWESPVEDQCGEVGSDATRRDVKPVPIVMQMRQDNSRIAVGLWGWTKPGRIVVLDHTGKQIGETAVTPTEQYYFRPWVHDLDGDGNDDIVALNGGKLQVLRTWPELKVLWEQPLPPGYLRHIVGMVASDGQRPDCVTVQHQNIVTAFAGTDGNKVWECVGPQPVTARGSLQFTAATLLDSAGTPSGANDGIPSVLFQYNNQAMVCQVPQGLNEKPASNRKVLAALPRYKPVSLSQADPRLIRRPAWAPQEGERLGIAKVAAWGMFVGFTLILLPVGTLYWFIERRHWSLRSLFWIPVLAGVAFTVLQLPAPNNVEFMLYSRSVARLIIGASFVPLLVFVGLLIQHARLHRWLRIGIWCGIALAFAAVFVVANMRNSPPLSDGEYYQYTDWDVPLAWGFYSASCIATVVVVLATFIRWCRQLLRATFARN